METARRNARLNELENEPRWPISAEHMKELSIYFPQEELNSIRGLRLMLDTITQASDLKYAVEVGCYRGVSTECLAMYCETLYAVDPWMDDSTIYDAFVSRMASYNNVITHRVQSPFAASLFEDGVMDLVYIDGMHTRPEVEADIRAWLPKVRSGGWIAGHDYVDYKDSWATQWINVIPAVKAVIGEPDVIFPDSSWIYRKP